MDMLSQLNSKTKILSFKNDVAVLVLKTTYDSNFTLLVVEPINVQSVNIPLRLHASASETQVLKTLRRVFFVTFLSTFERCIACKLCQSYTSRLYTVAD